MSVQDDAREKNMVRMFNLKQHSDRKRHDPDAYLISNGSELKFELKSTTTGSLSTVRDFGRDHIEKWKEMHWIVGFYDKNKTDDPVYCVYVPPSGMKRWVDKMWEYVRKDYETAEIAAEKIAKSDVYRLFGEKNSYTLDDAKSVQKNQLTAKQYRDRMDHPQAITRKSFRKVISPVLLRALDGDPRFSGAEISEADCKEMLRRQSSLDFITQALNGENALEEERFSYLIPEALMDEARLALKAGHLTHKKIASLMKKLMTKTRSKEFMDVAPGYSPDAMLEVLKGRVRYLIHRGSTLNNPHIPREFFEEFEKIFDDPASTLRRMIRDCGY
jgi:hypothetical protein